MTNEKGLFTYVNPAFTSLYGYTSEEVLNIGTPKILKSGETPSSEYATLWSTLGEGKVYRGEISNKARDGRIVIVSTCVSPIISEAGMLKGYLAIQRDIIEQKNAVADLKESATRFKTVVETLHEGLVITDLDENIIFVNERLASICGYLVEDLIGVSSEVLVWPAARKTVGQRIESHRIGLNDKYEIEFLHKDGTKFPVEVSACPYVDSENRVIGTIAVVEDISDKKRAEHELTMLEKQLRQAQKMEAIGTLAGGIAHDFNNILTPIVAYTDMMISQNVPDPIMREDLNRVMAAALRAKDLVKQILTFSRQTENDRFILSPAPIIKEVIKLLDSTLPSTISIIDNTCKTRDILADPTQIHQVIMNLCTNAAHALGDKDGVIEVGIVDEDVGQIFAQGNLDLRQGNYVKISVSDTGCGMDAETLSRIFEPFYTTKAVGEGTGLGLPVVHGIVKACGGDIQVISEPGKGSQFHIYFPAVEPVAKVDVCVTDEFVHGTETILIVDDEPEVAMSVSRSLEQFGFHTIYRSSSNEAYEAFKAKADEIDLLVTDLTMPHMTGDRLAMLVKQIRPDLPIVLMSGFSEYMNDTLIRELGITSLIMKPVLGIELAKAVRAALDNRNPMTIVAPAAT